YSGICMACVGVSIRLGNFCRSDYAAFGQITYRVPHRGHRIATQAGGGSSPRIMVTVRGTTFASHSPHGREGSRGCGAVQRTGAPLTCRTEESERTAELPASPRERPTSR